MQDRISFHLKEKRSCFFHTTVLVFHPPLTNRQTKKMPRQYQSMNIPQHTPMNPHPRFTPSILERRTRKSHIETIDTIIVNFASPAALRKFGMVKARGQKRIVCHILSRVAVTASE